MPDRRLKAVWDVNVPVIRELAGVHEYDGVVMDLPLGGRNAALDDLGPSSPGERLADRHDESHLSAAEQAARAEAGAGILRWNPLPHIQNLDLSCYDREYAPAPERRRAREAHLVRWPEAVDASLESACDEDWCRILSQSLVLIKRCPRELRGYFLASTRRGLPGWASWSQSGIGCTRRRTLLLDSNASLHVIAARSCTGSTLEPGDWQRDGCFWAWHALATGESLPCQLPCDHFAGINRTWQEVVPSPVMCGLSLGRGVTGQVSV